MPGMRKPGMDHEYYDWSPIVKRPPLRWPNGERVALCVIVRLEHYEWKFAGDSYVSPDLPGGGLGRRAFPDIASFSYREYGNRVGIYRLMEVLDKHNIRATVALDATIARHYASLVRDCKTRGWEFIGHGEAVTRMITSQMSEERERDYIARSLEAVEQATGLRPVGWLGPEAGESTRTPALLAEAGVRYVCDWPNDEQPFRMKVPNGTLCSLPTLVELDDAFAHWNRHVPIERWQRMLEEAFDVLYDDGAKSGRLMALTLSPWLSGQPFRVAYLDKALDYICRRAGVWKATGQEIIDWYLSQH